MGYFSSEFICIVQGNFTDTVCNHESQAGRGKKTGSRCLQPPRVVVIYKEGRGRSFGRPLAISHKKARSLNRRFWVSMFSIKVAMCLRQILLVE